MNVFHRKLYALIQSNAIAIPSDRLACLNTHLAELDRWWQTQGNLAAKLAQPQTFEQDTETTQTNQPEIEIRHPISGQSHRIPNIAWENVKIPDCIFTEPDAKKVYTWLWRFYPQKLSEQYPSAHLYPSQLHSPDAPIHGYGSTVAAITGALFPEGWQPDTRPERPYILLFTFSPVQEFVKASRKLLDFWGGSYSLHYLSAWLCWQVAAELGMDSVLTPSLWSQPIADAFLYQSADTLLPECPDTLAQLKAALDDSSLRVAGFPNYLAIIVSGKDNAIAWQTKLKECLRDRWLELGRGVRECIKFNVREYLQDGERLEKLHQEICQQPADLRDLELWQQGGVWEWNALWETQLENTWESYTAAIPLGDPDFPLEIAINDPNIEAWIAAQENITQSYQPTIDINQLSSDSNINVGIWWAKTLARLARTIQETKNTRNWAIPAAPGQRSSVSGLFSALHPRLLYRDRFREGGGLSEGTQRLFWRLLAKVFVGIFDASEQLNAIELTKRMGWCYGDRSIATTLGIEVATTDNELDYEQIIRFPNLSSIASARFAYDSTDTVKRYWKQLESSFPVLFPALESRFYSRTRNRPFHVPKVDTKINPSDRSSQYFNGTMFAAKWLAEDCGISDTADMGELRSLISNAHKTINAGEQSPSDWWALVYGDGDSMGQYISGRNLLTSDHYLASDVWETTQRDRPEIAANLQQQKKRMGATTQTNLNRALLDFSNRLVPMLAEKRFCGKVIYSGGDDVMVALPLPDLAPFLVSLRAAWSGHDDPHGEFEAKGGYWYAKDGSKPPFFTMGENATMSCGVVIANKGVPLATVLNHIWQAEKDRAKKVPEKDGLCFRVVYSSGNVLEAILKGKLLAKWECLLELAIAEDFSPLLYRLSEELPRHTDIDLAMEYSPGQSPLYAATNVIINSRGQKLSPAARNALLDWLTDWQIWAIDACSMPNAERAFGTTPEDLSNLFRFTAFMCDRAIAQQKWQEQKQPQGVANGN